MTWRTRAVLGDLWYHERVNDLFEPTMFGKKMFGKKLRPVHLARNLSIVIGLVFVWRGIWYVLDGLDFWLFGGSHTWTAIGGIVVGLLVLYIPDKDLKEIEKL